jgi:hypothetical protein
MKLKSRKLPSYGGASPSLPTRPRPPKTISGRRPVTKPPPKLGIGMKNS